MYTALWRCLFRYGGITVLLWLTRWPLGDVRVIPKVQFSNSLYRNLNQMIYRIMYGLPWIHKLVNSSTPGQNGRQFADDIFKCVFMNEKFCILIQVSLKSVLKGPIDNTIAFRVMAWCRTGHKPLPELMLTRFTDAYMRHDARRRWVKSIGEMLHEWPRSLFTICHTSIYMKLSSATCRAFCLGLKVLTLIVDNAQTQRLYVFKRTGSL